MIYNMKQAHALMKAAALLVLFPALAAAFASEGPTVNTFSFKTASACGEFAFFETIKTATSEALGLSQSLVEVNCLAARRRLQTAGSGTSASGSEYTVTVVGSRTIITTKETKAKLKEFLSSGKLATELGRSIWDIMLDDSSIVPQAAFVDTCRMYEGETCGLKPDHIRLMCSMEVGNESLNTYNPTVGVDSVSGGVKATNTFPLAPGLASKNSAVNFLKSSGYDSGAFGKDVLKYTFNANKLWSAGDRNYALPDTVSVYTATTSCSLETETVTSAIASSADVANSESTRTGKGFSQQVDVKAKEGPVSVSTTLKTEIGFGKSSGTQDYERSASQGFDQEFRIRAKAVAYAVTIDTSSLQTCDMNEYFVADVLEIAQLVEATPDSTTPDMALLIDDILHNYGSHLPTKFELGCEVERSLRFSSSMDEAAKQNTVQEASNKGFSFFGFSSSTATSSTETSSNSKMVSSFEAVSSTKITCGSQSGTLDDFCDSVVMNNDQSHIPKMLSVDKLEPIWNIIAQIDPWLGDAMQASPEISKASIKRVALMVEQRFELLSEPPGEATCQTAGSLVPPSEPGVCAFDGSTDASPWDCSKCSCYNINFDPENPLATPQSSCGRSVCKPDLYAKRRPNEATENAFKVYTASYPVDKVECHHICLNLPSQRGLQCHGFYFDPYDTTTYTGGQCLLFSKHFTPEDVSTSFVKNYDEDGGGAYYQYTPRKNGCYAQFEYSKVFDDRKCAPGKSEDNTKHGSTSMTQFKCFQACADDPTNCAAATYRPDPDYTCTLYENYQCTSRAEESGSVTKAWCGRAAPYIPASQYCTDNKRWYNCGNPRCNEAVPCSDKGSGLEACACPETFQLLRQQCNTGGRYYLCGDLKCQDIVKCPDDNQNLEYCACEEGYTPPDTYVDIDKQQCEADNLWYSCEDRNCNLQRECKSNKALYDCACPPMQICEE